jgi:hypothetical protein
MTGSAREPAGNYDWDRKLEQLERDLIKTANALLDHWKVDGVGVDYVHPRYGQMSILVGDNSYLAHAADPSGLTAFREDQKAS